MSSYKDGDPGFSLIRPGERPTEYGPANGRDFAWVKGTWLERVRGRERARSIEELKNGLELSTEYQHAAKAYEESRQALALAREQAVLLPIKLEQERQRLNAELLAIQGDLEEIIRRRELAHADHEIAMLERHEQQFATKLRIKKLKLKRRELKASRREPRATEPRDESVPEEFRRNWETEQRVRANRSEAEARIAAIYDRARVERRNLTADEVEEIDALGDTAAAAEAEVRRRTAAGF